MISIKSSKRMKMKQNMIDNGYLALEIDLETGSFDLYNGDIPFLKGCTWGCKLKDCSKALYSTDEFNVRSCIIKVYEDVIGKGKLAEITCTGAPSGIEMVMKIVLYDGKPEAMLELVLYNASNADVQVLEVYSAMTSVKTSSGLFFMKDPERTRILEAGLGGVLDLNVRCVFGNEESDSNGNVLVHDLDTKRNFLCGLLERPSAMVEIQANEDASKGMVDEATGLMSFGDWKIKKSIVPCKNLHPGGVITSHKMYFDLDARKSPHEMLESYAENLAKYLGIMPWPRDRAVPHGWNSWGNPTKTDPKDENGKNAVVYVHDITEERVLANFNLVLEKLVKFGLEYFQIDDGHQPQIGDWEADPAKFPNGLKPVFDAIHSNGIKTGLWINPFEISLSSKTYKEHPELTKNSQGLERIIAEFHARLPEMETILALGGTIKQATANAERKTMQSIFIPMNDSMRNAGFFLPGAAVGLIITGTPPVEAMIFQCIMFLSWMGGTIISATIVNTLATKQMVNIKTHQINYDVVRFFVSQNHNHDHRAAKGIAIHWHDQGLI